MSGYPMNTEYLKNLESDFFVIKPNNLVNTLFELEKEIDPSAEYTDRSCTYIDDEVIFETLSEINSHMSDINVPMSKRVLDVRFPPSKIHAVESASNFASKLQEHLVEELRRVVNNADDTVEIYVATEHDNFEIIEESNARYSVAVNDDYHDFIIDKDSRISVLHELYFDIAKQIFSEHPEIIEYIDQHKDLFTDDLHVDKIGLSGVVLKSLNGYFTQQAIKQGYERTPELEEKIGYAVDEFECTSDGSSFKTNMDEVKQSVDATLKIVALKLKTKSPTVTASPKP